MVEHQSPYPAYKPSGVEWLGDVPAHWEVRRLRNLVEMRASNVDKHVRDDEESVRLCNYVDVYKHERIGPDIDFMPASATADEIDRFKLATGDVLITKDSEDWTDIGVPAVVEEAPDDVLCGYHLALFRPRAGIVQGRFLFRGLQSKAVASQFHVRANGVTRFGLSHDAIKSVWLPVPPHSEQVAIALFLDHANSRIDRYISAKEKLITLLEEQKRAIIHEAVTGHIDVLSGRPYPAYKHARVEWQQEMPQHWERVRLKALLRSVDRRSTTGDETLLSLRRDHGVVIYAEHFSRPPQSDSLVNYKIVEAGQLVVNRLQANNGLVFCSSLNGLVSPDYSVFERRVPLNMVFLSEALRTSSVRAYFRRHSTGLGTGTSGFLRLYDDKFLNTPVPLPPVAEQDKIVAYIDKIGVSMEAAIRRSRRQIDLLRDYRTRLVADVVTGKVDVREAAVVVPDEGVFAEKDGLEKRQQPLGENG